MVKRQVLIPLIIVVVLVLLGAFFFLFKSQNKVPSTQEKMLEIESSVTPIGEENSSDEESQGLMDSDSSSLDVQDEDIILEEEIIE